MGLYPVDVNEVSHFGIMSGVWEDKDCNTLNVSSFTEKPKASYAEEFLGVRNAKGEKEYCSVFGQYILTSEVFHQLEEDIRKADAEGSKAEVELTAALEAVRKQIGITAVRLKGERFDMGNQKALVDTISRFSQP